MWYVWTGVSSNRATQRCASCLLARTLPSVSALLATPRDILWKASARTRRGLMVGVLCALFACTTSRHHTDRNTARIAASGVIQGADSGAGGGAGGHAAVLAGAGAGAEVVAHPAATLADAVNRAQSVVQEACKTIANTAKMPPEDGASLWVSHSSLRATAVCTRQQSAR